jgi:hypothetical protein
MGILETTLGLLLAVAPVGALGKWNLSARSSRSIFLFFTTLCSLTPGSLQAASLADAIKGRGRWLAGRSQALNARCHDACCSDPAAAGLRR